nr:hypothetical protein [uncultured Ligilactobacillus sp.]
MSKTKKVISQETQERITNSIIQLLAEESCTLADYEEIHELVINYYKDNATLKVLVEKVPCEKDRSVISKAKSIAFDSCDERIHKLCREIIELAKGKNRLERNI